jgi:Ca-activated chloride channel homolog
VLRKPDIFTCYEHRILPDPWTELDPLLTAGRCPDHFESGTEMNVKRLFCSVAGSVVMLMTLCLLVWPQTGSQTQTPTKKADQNQRGQEVDSDDVIRINTNMVNSPVLIVGRNGKYIPNLTRDDFVLLENGVPQEIAHFATVDNPFTVALLIDTSRSTSLDLENIKDAAISLVERMRPNDRAVVISYSDQINVLAEATSDKDKLKLAIKKCRPEGNSRTYDAVSFALSDRLNAITGRSALVVFSDGVDNDSRNATFESTLEVIHKTLALVFPVQLSTYDDLKRASSTTKPAPPGSGFSREDYVRADTFLHQAAAISGTGVYPAQEISDLETAIASISDELHNEYSIGYYPRTQPGPNEQRRVEVKTRLPQLLVKARTSYSIDASGGVRRTEPDTKLNTLPSNYSSIGASPLTRTVNDSVQGTDARWICKSVDVSSEFVVVKEAMVSNCPPSTRPNDETNAWFIQRPASSEIMCKGFLMWRGKEVSGAPLPTGFVVSGEVNSPNCARSNNPSNPANAWKIRQPQGRETVCKGFQLPRGFVTVTHVQSANCPGTPSGKNALIIRPK